MRSTNRLLLLLLLLAQVGALFLRHSVLRAREERTNQKFTLTVTTSP